MHPYDVWMVDSFQGHYLSLHRLPLHAIIELRFLINLDGILLHGCLVITNVNHGIGTLSHRFTDLIVIQLAVASRSVTWLIV